MKYYHTPTNKFTEFLRKHNLGILLAKHRRFMAWYYDIKDRFLCKIHGIEIYEPNICRHEEYDIKSEIEEVKLFGEIRKFETVIYICKGCGKKKTLEK